MLGQPYKLELGMVKARPMRKVQVFFGGMYN